MAIGREREAHGWFGCVWLASHRGFEAETEIIILATCSHPMARARMKRKREASPDEVGQKKMLQVLEEWVGIY